MQNRRSGFTLIELLIVIVIIGILAAIAIPKFGSTREKAYERAMMSDLRNLQAQQELYYSDPANNYTYAADEANLDDFVESAGVDVVIDAGDATGWRASATHTAIPDVTCEIAVGDDAMLGTIATELGVVTCETAAAPVAP